MCKKEYRWKRDKGQKHLGTPSLESWEDMKESATLHSTKKKE